MPRNVRLTIKEVRETARAKGGKFLSKTYKNNQTRYRWECANGHRWSATTDKIRFGRWCPYCSEGVGEELTRVCFQRVFKRRFPKARPDWLRLDPQHTQELDGYNPRLGVAFEHHGRQHYARERRFFHRSPNRFRRQVSMDRRKHRLCRERGIRLVKIPEIGWKFPLEKLLSEVIRRCRRLGIPVPARAHRLRINYATAWNRNREEAEKAVRLLRRYVKEQRGKWLDPKWMGGRHKYHFQCASGHKWKTDFYGILSGRWCPICRYKVVKEKHAAWWASSGGKKLRERLRQKGQRHLIRLKDFAKKRGGECLSKEFLGFDKKHRFRCGDCDREWNGWPKNLLVHKGWCKPCAQRKRWAERLRKLDYLGRMKAVAIKNGGECLSTKWMGALASYRFRCGKCLREWQTKPSVILIRGGWCISCSLRKRHARNRVKRRSPSPT